MSNIFYIIFKQHSPKALLILLVNIFTLWLLTIATTHISDFPPDVFYYAKQMPIFYWIGIFLLCIVIYVLFYLNLQISRIKFIEFSCIALLILYLFGLPSFIYDNPRLLDVHLISRYVENLIVENHTAGEKMYIGVFTGSVIFYSILSLILGKSSLVIANYYTIYIMFVISLGIYFFAKNFTKRYCFFAPITHISACWMSLHHMTPQSYAFTLATFMFPLLMSQLVDKTKSLVSTKILIILLWFPIVFSHALTPILTLIVLFLMAIFSYILAMISEDNSKKIHAEYRFIYTITILFVVIYIFYIIYTSNFIIIRIYSTIETIIENIMQGDTVALQDRAITSTSCPSYSYILGYWLRMFVVVITIIFGFACSGYVYLKTTIDNKLFVASGLFFGYFVIAFSLVISGFNVYGFDRAYMSMLVPYSILMTMVLDIDPSNNSRHSNIFKNLIVFVVIISIILMPATRYASDPYGYISDSYISGEDFIFNHQVGNIESSSQIFYNFYELKLQQGQDYLMKFDSGNRIKFYSSGQIEGYSLVIG